MIIDAHQHFWTLSRGDYDWLTPALAPLHRDFTPDDLVPLMARNGVGGTVLVQAAPTVAETTFLLQLADRNPFILGVVGWIDFEAPQAADDIERLADHPRLVGLRPMIQDIADDNWILKDTLTPAIDAMIAFDLTFDALVLPRHLKNLLTFLRRHPRLRTVVDHGAKPEIAASGFDSWAKDIAAIARHTGAYCKLSGLLTEAGPDAGASELAPYIAHLRKQFGPNRLIWGSDWPVLNLAADYDRWFSMARDAFPDPATQALVFGENCRQAYWLDRPVPR